MKHVMAPQGGFFSGVLAGDHAQVVQTAGAEHDLIDQALAPAAKGLQHAAPTLDPADDMLDSHPEAAHEIVARFLRVEEIPLAVLLLGGPRRDARRSVTLEGTVPDEQSTLRIGQAAFISQFLVVHAARAGWPQ